MRLVGSAIAALRGAEPFRIMAAKFSKLKVDLIPKKVVATASTNLESLVDSHPSYAEVFGLISDNR